MLNFVFIVIVVTITSGLLPSVQIVFFLKKQHKLNMHVTSRPNSKCVAKNLKLKH